MLHLQRAPTHSGKSGHQSSSIAAKCLTYSYGVGVLLALGISAIRWARAIWGAADLPFFRPRSWLRLCRCAGSSVLPSPALGNGCDSVDVPGPNGLLLSFVLVLAPACAYDYDDCDLLGDRGFYRAGVRLRLWHFGCGAEKFWARACACGDDVRDTRFRTDVRRLTFFVWGRLSALSLCFVWALFHGLAPISPFLDLGDFGPNGVET